MQFPKQKMADGEILKSKPIKEIAKYLDAVDIKGVKENKHRVYRNPSSGKNASIFTLDISGGIELIIWVSAKGKAVRVELNHDVLESATANEEEADITTKEVAKEILKKIHAEQKAEFRVKIDKRKIGQLIDDLDREDSGIIIESLTALKKGLTKGSGKFLIVNDQNKFYGANGYTSKRQEIILFDTEDEAKKVSQDNDKIVRI